MSVKSAEAAKTADNRNLLIRWKEGRANKCRHRKQYNRKHRHIAHLSLYLVLISLQHIFIISSLHWQNKSSSSWCCSILCFLSLPNCSPIRTVAGVGIERKSREGSKWAPTQPRETVCWSRGRTTAAAPSTLRLSEDALDRSAAAGVSGLSGARMFDVRELSLSVSG